MAGKLYRVIGYVVGTSEADAAEKFSRNASPLHDIFVNTATAEDLHRDGCADLYPAWDDSETERTNAEILAAQDAV